MNKTIISITLTLTTCLFVSSQNENFSIQDGLIYWQKVYETSKDINNLKSNPRLEFVTDSTGKIKKTNFNDKNLRELTGEFLIESKDNRYRVSVFNVVFYVEPTTLKSSSIEMQTISEYTIEKSLIKKNGTIRERYLGYNLTETLNPHLESLFSIKDKEQDDW